MLGDEGETTVFGAVHPSEPMAPSRASRPTVKLVVLGSMCAVKPRTPISSPCINLRTSQVPTTTFTKLADTSTGENQVVAVAVSGKGGVENTTFDDRIMLATGPMIQTQRKRQ